MNKRSNTAKQVHILLGTLANAVCLLELRDWCFSGCQLKDCARKRLLCDKCNPQCHNALNIWLAGHAYWIHQPSKFTGVRQNQQANDTCYHLQVRVEAVHIATSASVAAGVFEHNL
jgi:hypothetical protein